MSSVDDFSTVEELNKWATERGLMDDDIVNLRRVQLMADAVSNQRDNGDHVCNICQQRFKKNFNLLRHKKSVHSGNEQHQCTVCFSKFTRPDALQRHFQTHNRKRKRDDKENNSHPAKKRNVETTVCQHPSETNETTAKCNWCGHNKILLANKKFCSSCSQQGRECKWCHRPLPERFYTERTDVCDRCVKRRQNWETRQQQGGGQINALDGTAQTEVVEPNVGNLWDILQFLVYNKNRIETILRDRFLNVKGMKWFKMFVKNL